MNSLQMMCLYLSSADAAVARSSQYAHLLNSRPLVDRPMLRRARPLNNLRLQRSTGQRLMIDQSSNGGQIVSRVVRKIARVQRTASKKKHNSQEMLMLHAASAAQCHSNSCRAHVDRTKISRYAILEALSSSQVYYHDKLCQSIKEALPPNASSHI